MGRSSIFTAICFDIISPCATTSTLVYCTSFPLFRPSSFPPTAPTSVPMPLSPLVPINSAPFHLHSNETTLHRPVNTHIYPFKANQNEKEWLSVLGVTFLLQESTPAWLRGTPSSIKNRAALLVITAPPISASIGHGYAEVGRVMLLSLCNRVDP